jgi:hypothetical protein
MSPTDHNSAYSDQSHISLLQPITGQVSHVTTHHAITTLTSNTVGKSEGHATLFIFSAKNIQLPTCTLSRATKLHFSKFWGLCPFLGAHHTPKLTILGPPTLTQHLILFLHIFEKLCFDLFFDDFFTVMHFPVGS